MRTTSSGRSLGFRSFEFGLSDFVVRLSGQNESKWLSDQIRALILLGGLDRFFESGRFMAPLSIYP